MPGTTSRSATVFLPLTLAALLLWVTAAAPGCDAVEDVYAECEEDEDCGWPDTVFTCETTPLGRMCTRACEEPVDGLPEEIVGTCTDSSNCGDEYSAYQGCCYVSTVDDSGGVDDTIGSGICVPYAP